MKALAPGTHVAIFHGLHRVMAAEEALRVARARHRLMPTPRPLTSSCGLAIAFPADELGHVRAVLDGGPDLAELWCSDGARYQRAELPTHRPSAGPEAP
ncbi:MAG: DUF3343 domain-containing protein [Deltaproteobacteria bacterium]|nr:DUF3343 domain-containing protein [Deltaproteobacteria bacterium]